MESRMREGVVGGRRTSVEIAFRGRASDGDSVTEVQRLQQQLAEAQAQLHQQGVAAVTAGPAKCPRRREDFMCSCAEEVIEWISDRQFDIQEEITKGNAAEVTRLLSLVVQAATSLQPVYTSMVAQLVPVPGTSSVAVTGSLMIQ